MSRLVDIDNDKFWDILFYEACVEGNQAKRIEKELNKIANDCWIPFTDRAADPEEREVYGCDMILSCPLPEEDEEILVTYKNGYVGLDTFLRDGYELYLDSGAAFITEAIAWKPKPAGYCQEGELNQ